MRTLVLNAGFEPMQFVSWEKALCLVISAKAEVVAEYHRVVRTVSQSFKLPSVVRLKRYVELVARIGVVRCTRKNILLRDRCQCQYCGLQCRAQSATIDHVVPRSKGGKTTWTNVVVACDVCNRRKGSRSVEDAGMKLLRKPRRPGWSDMVERGTNEVIDAWLPFLRSVRDIA
jgi:5-methylcytosine-specific restriction endonuclease McrA